MHERGVFTKGEILSQPGVWEQALAAFRTVASELKRFWQANPADLVLFTGCGSTYYLSLSAAAVFQSLTGVLSQARPASELALFPSLVYLPKKRTLLVAISRSGATTETLEAVGGFKNNTGGKAIVITCDSHSHLANKADFLLAIDTAQEASVAQTRSFSSMTLLSQALAGHLSGQDIEQSLSPMPDLLNRLLADYQDLARQLGESPGIERFFFLGSGMLYGIACEAMLKMKEMSLSYSEAYHPLEFRHGPMAMVDTQSLVVGMISEAAQRQELDVLRQMRNLGGQTLAICEANENGVGAGDYAVELRSSQPDWARPVLYLPFLQLMAYYRAVWAGQNPDHPQNLDAVVQLKKLV